MPIDVFVTFATLATTAVTLTQLWGFPEKRAVYIRSRLPKVYCWGSLGKTHK